LLVVTGADGFYELWVDHPGEYTAEATLPDGATKRPSTDVVIPDVASYLLDLTFDSVTVSGRVTSEENEQPIAEAHIRVYLLTVGAVAVSVSGSRTNAERAFRLELEPGNYQLRVEADGYAPKRASHRR